MEALKVTIKPIGDIFANVNNAKVHNREQIEKIKKSILDFGMNDPIAIWNNEIVEGHGRIEACRELGIAEVPTIDLSFLTEEQKNKYVLVHNKLTLNTGFDYDKLIEELSEIDGIDMQVFGFKIEEEDDFDFSIENTEYSLDEFDDDTFEYVCPECGFRFNV